jgi:general secretion pathway protein L
MSAGSRTSPLPPSATAEFFDWWKAELRGWLGTANDALHPAVTVPPADITIERDTIIVGQGNARYRTDQASDAIASLSTLGQPRRRKLNIHLAADRFVLRRLGNGRIPLERAYRMAELDVSANTPFDLDNVYVLFASDNCIGRQTDYVLLKRSLIDPLLEAMKANRCRLGSISLETKGATRELAPYAIEYLGGNRHPFLQWVARRWFAVGACVAVAIAVWNVFSSLEYASATVDAAIERAEPAAQKARAVLKRRLDDVSRLQALYRERQGYVPAAKILEELTRIIPDDTFLTDFTLRNHKIQLSGFSTSAAKLIAIIDASPLFENPRFTTAVVKVPGQNGEQFSLELEVKHVG